MPDKPEIIKTTIRVPKPLWDRVRIFAIEHNGTAEGVVITALSEFIYTKKRATKKSGASEKGGKP